jgi:uncharacterized membrane protein YGL010W
LNFFDEPIRRKRFILHLTITQKIQNTMLGNRPYSEWISEYSAGHQNKINRIFHTLGIPSIVISLLLFVVSIFVAGLWKFALVLFLLGWIFQFVGHWFEGKAPEFFKDWRFLFVGLRWWWAKVNGRG